MQNAVIVDVEASTAVRQAEVTAAKRMIERAHHDLGLWPRKLIADTGYGSAEMLAHGTTAFECKSGYGLSGSRATNSSPPMR